MILIPDWVLPATLGRRVDNTASSDAADDRQTDANTQESEDFDGQAFDTDIIVPHVPNEKAVVLAQSPWPPRRYICLYRALVSVKYSLHVRYRLADNQRQ